MPIAEEVVRTVDIPDGVTVTMDGHTVKVKGPKGELSREFVHPRLEIKIDGGKVVVRSELPKKKEAALVGTWAGHISNMIRGSKEGWEYHLKVRYSHFPIKTKVDKNTHQLVIENFLGEKHPRFARILDGVDVTVKGEDIIVRSVDIEKAGQTAANIERATIIRNYDPKVFQDGIYIVKKAHEE